jgi:hypothetical protein
MERTPSMSIDRRSRSRSASADQTANEASQAAITHDGDVTHVAPLSPPASLPPSVDTRTGPSTNDLMEREQGIVDAMLLRFKNIIELATTNKGDVTSEVAASQAFQTNVETQALVCLLLSDSSRE